MIVVEEKLRELFDLIPEIKVNENNINKPTFSWGNELALNQFLLASFKDKTFKTYPLIWLLPSKDEYNSSLDILSKRVSLIISTRETNKDYLNDTRLQKSFKYTLIPLVDYVLQALNNGSITNSISIDIEQFKYPNYAVDDQEPTIDRWDAIRIDLDVVFNNNCVNPIKWLKPKNVE